MKTYNLTQADITKIIILAQNLDRFTQDLRKADDSDNGTAVAANRISDACYSLAGLFARIDEFQDRVGAVIEESPRDRIAHFKRLGCEWDQAAKDRAAA